MPRKAGREHAVLATIAYLGAGLFAVPAAASPTGGSSATPPPRLQTVECRTLCSGTAAVRPGSRVALKGRRLKAVREVTFLGSAARGDEAAVAPERTSRRRVYVRVPTGAASGRVSVTDDEGLTARATRRRLTVERLASRRVQGDGVAMDIAVNANKAFFDASRRPSVTFTVHGSAPANAVVDVVREADRAVVASYDEGLVAPGETRVVSWNGRDGATVAPDGRYEFRVRVDDGQGATASSAQARSSSGPSPDSFLLVGHKFPVRGKHDYGGFAATFGGGRGHKGQDVFAACGTPLAAARGGTVKLAKWHDRAGHYVIIDGERTGVDYAYMHLQESPNLAKGQRVRTGQIIGRVGDTGRASGCHLHFEMWSGPGWYTGGSPFDPLPHLKAWDRHS